LLAAFCQFSKTGTLLEWCELLRAGFGAQGVLTCGHHLLTPPGTSHVAARHQPQPHTAGDAAPHDAAPHDSTPHDATPHDATPHDATPHDATPHNVTPRDATPHDADTNVQPHENDADYFKKKFREYGDYKIQILVRAAQSIAKFKDVQILPGINDPKNSGPRDPMTQAIAMYQTVKRVSDRKYRVYFADAVERYTLSAPTDESEQTKKTAAFNRMVTLVGALKPEVSKFDLEGNKCLECMRIGGAASLYSIGCSANE
jgi:hypothetical protein